MPKKWSPFVVSFPPSGGAGLAMVGKEVARRLNKLGVKPGEFKIIANGDGTTAVVLVYTAKEIPD